MKKNLYKSVNCDLFNPFDNSLFRGVCEGFHLAYFI